VEFLSLSARITGPGSELLPAKRILFVVIYAVHVRKVPRSGVISGEALDAKVFLPPPPPPPSSFLAYAGPRGNGVLVPHLFCHVDLLTVLTGRPGIGSFQISRCFRFPAKKIRFQVFALGQCFSQIRYRKNGWGGRPTHWPDACLKMVCTDPFRPPGATTAF